MTMKKDKYRFDDTSQCVYQYWPDCHGYLLLCSYRSAGIHPNMSTAEKVNQVNEFEWVFGWLEE